MPSTSEPSPLTRRAAAFAAVLLLGAGGLVACGDDGDEAPPPTTAGDDLQEGDVSGGDMGDGSTDGEPDESTNTNPPGGTDPDAGDTTGEQMDE